MVTRKNKRQKHLSFHWVRKRLIIAMLVCGILIGSFPSGNVLARPTSYEGPNRFTTITMDYTTYEWWLLSWKDSQVLCQVYLEHEGWPDESEVQYHCGLSITNQWQGTSPCIFSETVTSASQCAGIYLHLANVTPATREVEILLEPADIQLSISDCNAVAPDNRCSTLPRLHLEGIEPLPNEIIISIQGFLNGVPFNCPGSSCDLPLPPTGTNGIPVQFWAESSYGDTSEVFSAQVRVIPWGDFAQQEEVGADPPAYYVDVLSTKLQGSTLSSCAQIWSAFTPVGGPPTWISTPEYVQDLVSVRPYYYLAGSMIANNMVDASMCENGGLQAEGVANQCGIEVARPLVNQWQNQFDGEILRVANETGIPAQLMKNVFSQESQFWPGIYQNAIEAGLGHLSDLGADTVLLWNPSFFSQFCPLVLTTDTCQRGFGNLDIAQQEMLRGALVQKVNAACPDCPMGINLEQANYSISIFARSMLANCEQVGQIIQNATQSKSGNIASYEDLWKFTLTNYNAGSGCLVNAIQRTIAMNQEINWTNVSSHLEPGCLGAIQYINQVSTVPDALPNIDGTAMNSDEEPSP